MTIWLIDEYLTERHYDCGYPTLADAALSAGYEVRRVKYVPFAPIQDIDIPEGSCVVTHGTVQFCRKVEAKYGRLWTPAMYFNANVKSFHKFATHLGDDLMNSDYYIIPWQEVVRRRLTDVFVKPLSGLKDFVGQVITDCDYDIQPNDPIDPECLCVVSAKKDIQAEFRYVISERKVITGSEYKWDNVLDVRSDTLPICDELAWKIAESEWQADTVYVCDVALLAEGSAKVVELNAFSSSGLYACDTNKIVAAVSLAAEREHGMVAEDHTRL